MRNRSAAIVSLTGLLVLSFGFSQSPTLDLEFGGELYLSHVSVGLAGLTRYRQSSVVTTITPGEDGETVETTQEEGRAYVTESNESASFSRYDLMPGLAMQADTYVVGGRGYLVGGSGDETSCSEMPVSALEVHPLETHVADATGFKSATLVAEGDIVHDLLTDRYELDPPPHAGRFEGGSIGGRVWIAREGGFIVKYEITGTDAGGVTTLWTYDLTEVGSLERIVLPEACAAL